MKKNRLEAIKGRYYGYVDNEYVGALHTLPNTLWIMCEPEIGELCTLRPYRPLSEDEPRGEVLPSEVDESGDETE